MSTTLFTAYRATRIASSAERGSRASETWLKGAFSSDAESMRSATRRSSRSRANAGSPMATNRVGAAELCTLRSASPTVADGTMEIA